MVKIERVWGFDTETPRSKAVRKAQKAGTMPVPLMTDEITEEQYKLRGVASREFVFIIDGKFIYRDGEISEDDARKILDTTKG